MKRRVLGSIAALALLARLLTPSDYGAVEAAMTCVLFLGMLSQLGVGPADQLVRKK